MLEGTNRAIDRKGTGGRLIGTSVAGQWSGLCQRDQMNSVGGVYAHKRGWRARMTVKKKDYVAPSRATPDLAAADLAEIRAVASVDEAVRVFERIHQSRGGGHCRRPEVVCINKAVG